ncbi:MAG: prepilin-type N-terminal cleavage/methylation domain-containing protein [Armatimonadetes bacterium]|nr:prepilin-type N-terminal cleavage/methylation domain-containing protein [Armatimonadota bacterium]
MKKRGSGFTLVEILVVLAIIAILAALLFPAFNRAKENARQTTCQSNLQQIYFAVKQYYNDERRYPDSLLDLMGEGVKYEYNTTTPGTIGAAAVDIAGPPAYSAGSPIPDKGTGIYKGGQDTLMCPNDEDTELPHSSYGALTKLTTATPDPIPADQNAGRYVWNYWGYRPDGFAYSLQSEAEAAALTSPNILVTPTAPFNRITNPIKYSMANRFAPTSTIITHCVFHRLQTANNINSPGELYTTGTDVDGSNARDIVLRLDGSAKPVDVSKWYDPAITPPDFSKNVWQNQTP